MSERSPLSPHRQASTIPSASTIHTTFRLCNCSKKVHGYFWGKFQEEEARFPVAVISMTAGRQVLRVMLESEKIEEAAIPRLEQELANSGLPEVAVSQEFDSSFTAERLSRLVVPAEILALVELLRGDGDVVSVQMVSPMSLHEGPFDDA